MIIIQKVIKIKKGYLGEDIYEGKMTLMVIHCLNNCTLENK